MKKKLSSLMMLLYLVFGLWQKQLLENVQDWHRALPFLDLGRHCPSSIGFSQNVEEFEAF